MYLPTKIWFLIVKCYWFTPIIKTTNQKENDDLFTEYVNRVIYILERGSNKKLRKVIACLLVKTYLFDLIPLKFFIKKIRLHGPFATH